MAADSACLRAQNQKAALKTHGVTAFTADQLAERDAEIRGAGYEEGVQDGIEATIAAQEEDMGKACVSKVVMGYGGGASIAAQQRLARFKRTFIRKNGWDSLAENFSDNPLNLQSFCSHVSTVSIAGTSAAIVPLMPSSANRIVPQTPASSQQS